MTDQTTIDATADPVRYEQDSYGWMVQQVEFARTGQRDAIDLPHVAQVLAGLAAQDRAKLGAALEQILEALLKWDHAPDARLGAGA